MISATAAKTSKSIDLGFSEREAREYSIAKAIQATTDTMTPGGFEKEVSDTLAVQLGRPPRSGRGIYIPTRIQASGLDTRTGAAGGFMTGEKVMDLTDVFRAQSRLVALGAQFIGGLKFNAIFASENSGTQAFWMRENAGLDVSQVDPTFRATIGMPHGLSCTTSLSSQLLAQAASSVALESRLRQDLARSHSAAFEQAAIAGVGSEGQPVGLLRQTGVTGVTVVPIDVNGGAPTLETILLLEQAVALSDAPGTVAWLASPGARKTLRKTFINGDGSAPIWEDNTILGRPAAVSTAVPGNLSKGSGSNLNAIICGVFSELLLLEWGVMEVVSDFWTRKKQGLIELTSISFVDCVLPRPSAFAVTTDIVVS